MDWKKTKEHEQFATLRDVYGCPITTPRNREEAHLILHKTINQFEFFLEKMDSKHKKWVNSNAMIYIEKMFKDRIKELRTMIREGWRK
jgi:hypothetical protein